ncbi:flagellar protein [Paenibacillus turpanensis]|uniref:flagellar protein n=1 Tax=Paenibacillus turpanensis TaxID=2689078 RepID=UPI00140CB7D5|nr:flagellar protein [Paenibacillus turpanensis]
MLPKLSVDHCPKCGSIYQYNLRRMCTSCSAEYDRQLNACIGYLRRHRKSDNERLSLATGVPAKQIISFITERRLSLNDYPNLSYHCELCGTSIRSEKLCTACRVKINNEIYLMFQEERRRQERNAPVRHSYICKDR